MVQNNELIGKAKMLSRPIREEILISLPEKQLHKYLKKVLSMMDPNAHIEITHGTEEYGKDLVMIRKDKFQRSIVGILVELGKIHGDTVGKVDEIKSKIEQAFSHPVKLKTTLKDLSVSDVWVMIAGEVSKNARQRMKREFHDKRIEIYDMDWLIDNFTDYYPQVFFDGELMDCLQKMIQELEQNHLFSKHGKNLSECFVEPLIATVDIPTTFDEDRLLSVMENIGKRRMPFFRLNSLLRSSTKIILVGEPGTGKSVALAKLVIDKLKRASDQAILGTLKKKVEIPLLVPASALLRTGDGEILIEEHIPYPSLRSRFKIDPMIVDGLDEVPSDRRKEVLEKITCLCRQLKCSVIVATRKIDVVKTVPSGFRKYELLPFELKQAVMLFTKLISDAKLLDTLKDGLEKVKFKIPMTPLCFMLLIELVKNYKEVPASITELYDRFSNLILGQYDVDKGMEVLFEYLVKKRFVASLAFNEFLQKRRLEITKDEFDQFLSDYADEYGWDRGKLIGFTREIERSGILGVKDIVVFQHRSFLDYFAAFHIYDRREEFKNLDDLIVQMYFDDIWGDVAFFYIGLRKEISNSILEKIFAFKKESLTGHVDKLLVGRLLQAGWHSPAKTKYSGIKKAVEFTTVLKEELLKTADKAKSSIPKIFADLFAMSLSDLSFRSVFLLEQEKQLFNDFSDEPSQDRLYHMLCLLWALRTVLPPAETRLMIDKCLECLGRTPNVGVEQQAIILLMLVVIEQKRTVTFKAIRRKLDRFRKKHPEVFRELVPRPKKQFRLTQRKRRR